MSETPGSETPGEETSWKIPVAAAILGALVTGIYVIFTIVTAPTEDPDAQQRDVAVESTGFPSGYAAVGSDVGMHGDVLVWDEEGTTVFVSSVVRGGTDPGTVTPVEVASWVVESEGGEISMLSQSTSPATPGAVTVSLAPLLGAGSVALIATLPGDTVVTDDLITEPADLPVTIEDHRIAVGEFGVIVDELVIDDEGGSIRWHLEGGVAAKVEVVASIDGLAFATSSDGTDFVPPWAQRGSTRLTRIGGAPPQSGFPAVLSVELHVSVVTEAGVSIDIPIGSVVGP